MFLLDKLDHELFLSLDMKFFDSHSAIGIMGVAFTTFISGYSVVMGAIAATGTAGYMVFRGAIEYIKFRRYQKELDKKTGMADSEIESGE